MVGWYTGLRKTFWPALLILSTIETGKVIVLFPPRSSLTMSLSTVWDQTVISAPLVNRTTSSAEAIGAQAAAAEIKNAPHTRRMEVLP